MNYSKLAGAVKTSSTSDNAKTITHGDFNIMMDIADIELGEYYAGKLLNSIYWSNVGAVLGSKKDQMGKHAPSYIAMKQSQEDNATVVIRWLHSVGYVPKPATDKQSAVADICDYFTKPINADAETAIVVRNSIRELIAYSPDINDIRNNPKKLVEAFKACPKEALDKYQPLIDTIVATKTADNKSAITETVSALQVDLQSVAVLEDIAPTKLYFMVSTLSDKVGEWIKLEEDKKFKEQANNNQGMVDKISDTLIGLDAFQARLNKMIHLADTADNTVSSDEFSYGLDDETNSVNNTDNVDAELSRRDQNEGFNI